MRLSRQHAWHSLAPMELLKGSSVHREPLWTPGSRHVWTAVSGQPQSWGTCLVQSPDVHLGSHAAQVLGSPQDGGLSALDVLSCPSLHPSSPPASSFCREMGGHRCPSALALVLLLAPY